MTRFKSPALPLLYCGLLLTALVVGCSTRETPNETLVLEGNHSPGTLTMVTTDTSSDGYNYLEPSLSPDGTRIAFTADWAALPSTDHLPETLPTIRQLVIMPNRVGVEPEQHLAQSGAALVPFRSPCRLALPGGVYWLVYPLTDAQKGSPCWLDNQTLVFWMHTIRGDRLCRADLTQTSIVPEIIYCESEDFLAAGRFWQHRDPAVSPDGQWVVFSRFGAAGNTPDSLQTYTKQQLWLVSLNRTPQIALPLTSEGALVENPAWSADGSRIAFDATLDLIGGGSFYGNEIFSITFDGAQAASGAVPLDQGLKRLTFTSIPDGNPIPIENTKPSFSADGSTLVFTSTRRAPSLTLHDRSIWRIPSDGRLEPVIAFFSREDDVQARFAPGSNNLLVLSSAMGFPTEMLDRLEQEARDAIRAADPLLNDVQVNQLAAAKRIELEYFARVMTHLFTFQGW
ncbi:MAG: TolB family protein [Candidatus Krumholzibacteriia bacterium]